MPLRPGKTPRRSSTRSLPPTPPNGWKTTRTPYTCSEDEVKSFMVSNQAMYRKPRITSEAAGRKTFRNHHPSHTTSVMPSTWRTPKHYL